MQALLLAAGMGTRLKEMTTELPKSLLPLTDRPILAHIFEAFENVPAITKVTVVTGFERNQIVSFLDQLDTRLDIEEVWNPDFKKGNFYSVETAIQNVSAPFFITNADHVFPSGLLRKTFQNPIGVSAVCDFDRKLTPDCMKVLYVDDRGHKKITNIHKKLETFNAGYIGMTVVAADGFDLYMNAFAKVKSKNEDNAYAEQVLQELALDPKTSPRIIDASGFGWLEVDTAEDLEIARDTVQTHPQFMQSGRQ